MKNFVIQKCVIDDLIIAGYRVLEVRSNGISFYYDYHLNDSQPLPLVANSYDFYKLRFNTYYKISE